VALRDVDLLVEGHAAKVSDTATLERIAARYAAQRWPARASEGALTTEYHALGAGPPPWNLYVFTPVVAFGAATRWRF